MKPLKSWLLALVLFSTAWSQAQVSPFEIYLEPVAIPGVNGLQSFAFGQHNGMWLIVGGRLDGLHRRQPFAAFDVLGNNNQLIVVEPVTQQSWTAPLSVLPIDIQEQLSSTNMEFQQEGDYLYLIGGYGYHAVSASRKTFNFLTAIDVPGVINAIINGSAYHSYFRQMSNPLFAVTGGHLEKIYDTYYLVGGNQFDGNYNPMGNPTFTQVYTNAARRFKLVDDGVNLSVNFLPSWTDANAFHRRDFNVVAQIMPNGQEGITAFSGVFQQNVDLPFLNCVNLDSSGYQIHPSFQQYYNHYHCAVLPIYSEDSHEMNTVFFGGIAQFYESGGTMIQDNNVPFVKTIARVSRDSAGNMVEYKLPIEMPGYLGAGSEFIPAYNIPQYSNGVLKLDELTTDTTLVGYVYGGISSSAPNIFFINTGVESSASSQVFKVYLIKSNTIGVDELNLESTKGMSFMVYPNPLDSEFQIHYYLRSTDQVEFIMHDINGLEVQRWSEERLESGNHALNYSLNTPFVPGEYFLTMTSSEHQITRKVMVK